MVQWAVSVGEIKSFQVVGLTQEVVEMLKRKKRTKLVLCPSGSFYGCVKYFLLYIVKVNNLSLLQMCLNLKLLHSKTAKDFCHQWTNRNVTCLVKIRSRSYSKWCRTAVKEYLTLPRTSKNTCQAVINTSHTAAEMKHSSECVCSLWFMCTATGSKNQPEAFDGLWRSQTIRFINHMKMSLYNWSAALISSIKH